MINPVLTNRQLFYLPSKLHHHADDLDRKGLDLGGGVALGRISGIDGPQLQATVAAKDDLLQGGVVAIDQHGAVVAAVAGILLAEDDGVALQVAGIHAVAFDPETKVLPVSGGPGRGDLFPVQDVLHSVNGDTRRDGAQYGDANGSRRSPTGLSQQLAGGDAEIVGQ